MQLTLPIDEIILEIPLHYIQFHSLEIHCDGELFAISSFPANGMIDRLQKLFFYTSNSAATLSFPISKDGFPVSMHCAIRRMPVFALAQHQGSGTANPTLWHLSNRYRRNRNACDSAI